MAIDDNTSYELTGAQVKDLANKIKAKAADNIFVGATSAIPGSKGLVPAPAAGDNDKVLSGAGAWVNQPTVPTVNDATLTIQQNGTTVDTFTANSSANKTVNIETITAETVAPAEEVGAITASMIDWSTIAMKGTWTTPATGTLGTYVQSSVIDVSAFGFSSADDYAVTVVNRGGGANGWAISLMISDKTATGFKITQWNCHWSSGIIGAGNVIDWAVFRVA